MKEKISRISVRVSDELKRRLVAAQKETTLDEPTIVRLSLEAFCRAVEIDGAPPLPLEFVSHEVKRWLRYSDVPERIKQMRERAARAQRIVDEREASFAADAPSTKVTSYRATKDSASSVMNDKPRRERRKKAA